MPTTTTTRQRTSLTRRRLRGRRGQGTVEYLGLVLVVGVLLVAVSQHVDGAAGVGKTISRSFGNAVDRVTSSPPGAGKR